MQVFLSCVSREFASYRLMLANQLGALPGQPYTVKVQEDFQQGSFTLLEQLADYIRQCDLVIHLVGELCGARPSVEHVRALYRSVGQTPPEPLPERSYTQWEYHLAQCFGRRLLCYVASHDAPRDCGPVQQSEEEQRLQQAHRAAIKHSGKHYAIVDGAMRLACEVVHDLGLEGQKVSNLPYKSLGKLFKGREEFLAKLRQTLGGMKHLGHQRAAAITAEATAVVVHGLGGVGKTQVAIEYAHRYADEFTALLFLVADSSAGLQQNLANLCGPAVFNLPEQDECEMEKQVAAALRWLQQHPGWFVIFDSVDTKEARRAVEELLGRLTSAGQVLITSRLGGWKSSIKSLELDVLAEDDATAYLLEKTELRRRRQPDDVQQARTVAVELGQLALALEQAGAYINKSRRTFAQYLEEWRSQHDRVLEWFDESLMQYPMSVAVTWQTSFNQLGDPAGRLLGLLGWFAPDPIPELLMESGGGPFAGLTAEGQFVPEARAALDELEAFSLARRADEEPTFTVHRLVQDVTRRSLHDDEENLHLKVALRWINAAFRGDAQDVRAWPVLAPLAPHVQAATTYADERKIGDPTTRLMNQLGLLLKTQVRFAEAEPLYRRALAIDENSYGPDHPNVARDLNNLAGLLQATNRLVEAEPLMRRALAIDENSYGSDHPDVARDLNNLAGLLWDTNRGAVAEPLMRRALTIDESSYGPDHPKVAIRLNNLAQLLQATNRLVEAEPLMRRALAIDENSYGLDHPNVARDLNNLAGLLQATNRLVEAEPLMRRALAIDENSYGSDHPDVARDLNNLAQLLKDTNRLAEAEPLMRRMVSIFLQFTRSTGHPHPHLRAAVNNYAGLFQAMGRGQSEIIATLHDMAPEVFNSKGPGGSAAFTPPQLRGMALELYQHGEYDKAAELLKGVLDAGFEVPSTCCHLARMALLTGQIQDGQAHVSRAWAERAQAELYIVPRILWLQLAFTLLAPGQASRAPREPSALSPILGKVKTALQRGNACHEWTMQPVLNCLQTQLSAESHTLLAALVAALNDARNLPALDAFAAWREATPQPLE